jgi:hypothetical protein
MEPHPMSEVPGLPATGPVLLATVKAELGYTSVDAARDARITQRVDAVNSWVRQLPVASESLTYGSPPPQWPAHVILGGTMLATRLWRRKDSPSGVEAFTDQGAVYVSRNDPDVALLLSIGNYSAPRVG